MSTGSSGTRGPYFVGRKREMTPEWKQAVRDKLALLRAQTGGSKGTQTWLAAQVGVDKSTITLMLKPGQVSGHAVEEVSEVLDIPLPVIGVDESDSDTLDDLKRLEPDDKEQVRALIAKLRKLRDQAAKP